MTISNDFLHRFQLEHAGVRGAIVRLDETWQRIRANGDYAGPLADLLGRTVAASALFTSPIKFEGRLSIHLRESGALRLLFADCTHDGQLRGIVRWDGEPPKTAITLEPTARLAITIENSITDSRYQGLVPVESGDLSRAFEGYFERSEQLPTRLVLAAADDRCGGLMLQQVATAGGAPLGDADGWNRAEHLLATLTPDELLRLPSEQVLLRLFHDEGVRLQPAQPLAFGCTCSYQRVSDMLRSLGRAENQAVLAEQGSIQVTCEFCNRQYVFDEADVAAVFADTPAEAEPSRRH
ncbi:MAG: Hsp33 family molecular chaperone HslO [Rudaea sp.]|uniref:Hsp33 family molecular chaperone HslO n=1 Tax=unclassified Rudaea TaxID=2627037 RepID=UPI0010FA27CB|nr:MULTISPECIES: Hsp33 family molecular chaperone HslO [unclassified Rudaea]MBN8888418.1 Hsp33 family molecular chaperone HslO [Rudaea sp.]